MHDPYDRYRFSLFKLFSIVRDTLDRFMNIYDLQSQCKAYESPQELWDALGLYNLTQVGYAKSDVSYGSMGLGGLHVFDCSCLIVQLT